MAESRQTKRAARQPVDLAYESQNAVLVPDVMSTNSTIELVALNTLVAEWVDAYGRRVAKTCFFTLRNWEDADDAAQRTFESALRHLRKHPGKVIRHPRAWLNKIATRLALRLREKIAKRQQRCGGTLTQEPHTPVEAGYRPDKADMDAVESALTRLTPRQSEALQLRLQDKSDKDIAELMGTSEGAVGMLILRATKQLRQFLNPTE